MATIGNTVLYLTPETPELASALIPAVYTGEREDGAILFLQGPFYLGCTVSQMYSPESPDPMQPGQWKEMPDAP